VHVGHNLHACGTHAKVEQGVVVAYKYSKWQVWSIKIWIVLLVCLTLQPPPHITNIIMSSDFFVVNFAIVWNLFFWQNFFNENFTFVKSKNEKEKEKRTVNPYTFLVLKILIWFIIISTYISFINVMFYWIQMHTLRPKDQTL
jgi:C4-dicarboxylate transporter